MLIAVILNDVYGLLGFGGWEFALLYRNGVMSVQVVEISREF